MSIHKIHFGPFSIEDEPTRLMRESDLIRLRPKSLEVLKYLAERPGQLVSKEELLKRVWTGRVINDTGLRVCVGEIRAALGDNADTPHYLETIVGQGFRFLEGPDGRARFPDTTGPIVGRESELRRLEDYYQLVADGNSQFVLLGGEPGIGKTTLVNCFLDRVVAQSTVNVMHAQCVVHFGKGEAYGALLEAIAPMARDPDMAKVLKDLKHFAPTWLLQMPGVLDPFEFEKLESQMSGTSLERMTREFCQVVEELAKLVPMIIVIEDLHWADSSTIDLLATLAQHPGPSKLLILGTYRPVDAILHAEHLRDIVQELKVHNQCEEVMLEYLSMEDVGAYLEGRLDGEVSTALSTKVFQRTNGNPLFMVTTVEDFIYHRMLVQREGRWIIDDEAQSALAGVPETLRSFISRRFEVLSSEERLILDAASIHGLEFSSAAMAGALEQTSDDIDRQCELLAAQGQFINTIGLDNWPDGTISGRYRFQHPLYLEVLYDQIGDARKARIHRHLGESLETGFGDRTDEIAAELATHFDRGRDSNRAIRYRSVAAEIALNRHAYPEAIAHLKRVIDILKQLPETPERDQQELGSLLILGPAQIAIGGYADPEVGNIFDRAQKLCERLEDDSHRATVIWNIAAFRMVRGELVQSRSLIEQFVELAKASTEDDLDLMAHDALAQQLFFEGELAPAHVQCEYVVSRYDITLHHDLAKNYSQEDPGVACSSFDVILLWLLGFPDQSLERMQTCMTLSRQLENPHSSGFGLFFTGVMYQLRNDPVATQKQADDLIRIAAEHDLHLTPLGKVLRGWAIVQQTADAEGLALVRSGLDMWRESGAEVLVPYCLGTLAETQQALGQIEDALASVVEALSMVEKTGNRWYEAELHRLQGELLLQQDASQHAEAVKCFRQALQVARKQQARSLELRAAMSLSRLWVQSGNFREAREVLEPVFCWFTEGLETEELLEARVLLDELVI